MKRSLLSLGMVAAMLLVASSALASGVNMRWDNCLSDGGVNNKTFACNINSPASVRFIGSFVEDADHNNVSGTEIVVDLIAQGGVLPAWWEYKNVGSCRINSLSIAAWGTGTNCFDWASGQATVAIAAYQVAKLGVGTSRILCISAVPVSALANLFGTFEYSVFALSINELASVGTGSCAGCSTPVCLVFNSVNITTSQNLDNRFIGQGTVAGSNIITWQGAGADCQAVPVKNATWGQVKSLYR